MNKEKSFFHLFPCCIPVKGATRSIICDLQRNNFEIIPNALFFILTQKKYVNIQKVYEICGNEGILNEYFHFLEQKEFGYFSDTKNTNVLEPPKQFISHSIISNCIIDFDNHSKHNMNYLKNELDLLGCEALQLRFFSEIPFQKIDFFLSAFADSRVRSIYVILHYSEDLSEKELVNIYKNHNRLLDILVHSSPENKTINVGTYKISYVTKHIDSEVHCGFVGSNYFTVNQSFFYESLQYNTCLNKKISIDRFGNVKNCPAMSFEFCNILDNEQSLLEIVLEKEFQKYWTISKDEILICKDCEFRYICPDCRVFIQDKEDVFSKPIKCNYNPYDATWS